MFGWLTREPPSNKEAPPAEKALGIAIRLCKEFEGLRLRPYLCPAGVPTVAYGSTFYEDGTPVKLSDAPVDEKRAMHMLRSSLERIYLPGVLQASPNLINNPAVLGAVTDFAYNLGVARYRASTLRRRINAEDWAEARLELAKWVNGGGKKLPGLVRRRAAEAAYFP